MEAPPVVDLDLFLNGGDEHAAGRRLELLQTVDNACKQFGLFQLINHGLDCELLSKVLQSGQEFFDLPLEYKCKFSSTNNTLGFVHQSGVVGDTPDHKEHFMSAVENNPLSESNIWPDLPPTFRSSVIELGKPMQDLCLHVMVLLEECLEVSTGTLCNSFRKTDNFYNLLHYHARSDYEGQVLAPHQDGTLFTVVSQLNRVPGYQVLKDGTWYTVMPEKNALIINLGDLLQAWTNGLYKGAVHRVVASKEHRYSFVYSFMPEANTQIAPFESFSENKPLYKSFLCKDYLQLRFENKRLGNKLGKNISIDHYAIEEAPC